MNSVARKQGVGGYAMKLLGFFSLRNSFDSLSAVVMYKSALGESRYFVEYENTSFWFFGQNQVSGENELFWDSGIYFKVVTVFRNRKVTTFVQWAINQARRRRK